MDPKIKIGDRICASTTDNHSSLAGESGTVIEIGCNDGELLYKIKLDRVLPWGGYPSGIGSVWGRHAIKLSSGTPEDCCPTCKQKIGK